MRFGSVGGGGRYDGLVSRFRGEPVPATGFSIGVSRLQAALTALGKLDTKPAAGPVLVTVFGAENVQPIPEARVASLRNAGIRAELYLGNPKHGIGQQLKYADRRGSPCAVIQGPDEKAKGEVQIRDLIAGAAPSDLKDRDEYLKKQAEAQFAGEGSRPGRRSPQAARPPQARLTPSPLTRICHRPASAAGTNRASRRAFLPQSEKVPGRSVVAERWAYPVQQSMQRHTGCAVRAADGRRPSPPRCGKSPVNPEPAANASRPSHLAKPSPAHETRAQEPTG